MVEDNGGSVMGVLGIDEVLRRVREDGLVANLGARELDNPEGVGVDLRVGQIHCITEGGAFIEADGEAGLGRRRGVQTKQLGEWTPPAAGHGAGQDGEEPAFVSLEPGGYYLVRTVESLKTPPDLMPVLYTRVNLFKAGLVLIASKTDPGYEGPLVCGLRNLSDFAVKIQLGARFCNLVFFQIDGRGTQYRGQHQGGRVAITETERQV